MKKSDRDAYNNLSRRRKNLVHERQKVEIEVQIAAAPKGHWCPVTRQTHAYESGTDCPDCFAVVP